MSIQIYNTLSKRKEEFKPLEPGKVKMYVRLGLVAAFLFAFFAQCFILLSLIIIPYCLQYVNSFLQKISASGNQSRGGFLSAPMSQSAETWKILVRTRSS